MRVTLAQVAKEAGFSPSTVSLVLNNAKNTRISEATAQKIRETAQRLGYRPNPQARSLRTGATDTIGFISDEVIVTRFASQMVRGITDTAAERGKSVMMAETGNHPEDLEKTIRGMVNRRIDGIIFGLMAAREVHLPQLPKGLPALILNGRGVADGGAHEGGAAPEPHLHAVLPKEFDAGYRAATLVLEAGHRNIGLIGRPPVALARSESVSIMERMAGIDRAIADWRLSHGPVQLWEHQNVDWNPRTGIAAMEQFEREKPQVSALIAANDRIAFGIYLRAAQLGYRIPQDFSVLSFDDEELASYLEPGLSTLQLPYRKMGEVGAQMIIDGLPETPGITYLDMPYIERASLRPLGV